MSKNDMIETIEFINAQLKENKELVNAYAGNEESSYDAIVVICELSQALLEIKSLYKEMLLWDYGVYYKG